MTAPLLSLALALVPQAETSPVRSLVALDLAANGLSLPELQALDFDIAEHRPNALRVHLLADGADLERLENLGLEVLVLEPDLARFYADRAAQERQAFAPALGAFLSPPFGSGSLAGFYTFSEVVSVLDQISAAYPSLTTDRFSIGTTIEGREIWAIKVSDNPDVDESEPEVRFDAMHHAREPESMQATIWAMLSLLENYGTDPEATYIVDNRELWFIPCVNPDGYVHNETTNPGGGGLWRKNRRNNGDGTFGVDLNRNYAFQWGFDDVGSSPNTSSETYRGTGPASEPEVAAMQAFIDSRNFATVLTNHTYSNLWLYPLGYVAAPPANEAEYAEVSALATEVNKYTAGPAGALLYLANGVTDDYDHGVHGSLCWTPEIGSSSDGFWPPPSRIVPLAEENELAMRRTALAAGAYVHEESLGFTDLGDGDGNFEPGEAFELLVGVRNSGLDASGTVDVAITSSDPSLVIGVGSAVIGSVASFSSQDNSGAPLALSIAPGAPVGVPIAFSVDVTYEGFTRSTAHTITVGERRDLVRDALEADLGWTAGLPGDTASTGLWAFGDPVGTTSNGEASNPEDDASPGAGVSCFTTGNGSTSAGGDDVDNGFTTLVSPAFDLSGVAAAEIGYSRWYTLLTTIDDDFEVSISDDDGATWTPLETVSSHENEWTQVSFDVGSFVSLTDKVRLRFIAQDDPNNSLTEAAVDEVFVHTFEPGARISVYGRKAIGQVIAPHVLGQEGQSFILYGSSGTASISLGNVTGDILIDPASLFQLLAGTIPAGGSFRTEVLVPNDPMISGMTFYVQALLAGGGLEMSNRVQVDFE